MNGLLIRLPFTFKKKIIVVKHNSDERNEDSSGTMIQFFFCIGTKALLLF